MFNQNQLDAVASTSPTPTPTAPLTEGDKVSLDNTDIYYMPENFQKNNQVAGKDNNIRGVWVLVSAIILLAVIALGLYVYWQHPDILNGMFNRQQPAPSNPQPVTPEPSTNSLTPAASTRPSGSPKEMYLVYRSELALASTVDAYLSVYARYATTAAYTELNDRKSTLESSGTQVDILSALKGESLPLLDGTEDLKEDVTDTQATVTITQASKREEGTAVFIAENGQWKLSKETWKSLDSTSSNGELGSAQDDDQDGLSNEEETALGTNSKSSDSDGDGFTDLAELNNGYNPTGTGKIDADAGLATYLNTTFNFSLLYPADWNRTIATTDDSIIFTAPDKQFVQVLVQPNADREDIVSWYKKTFSVETIPNTQLVSNPGWDGVRTPDGMTAYLTNKDKSYIFIATYNVGGTKIIKYKNIFEMVLRSLKLTS